MRKLKLWPSWKQFLQWSLPSKLTLIGTYVGIVSLILTVGLIFINEEIISAIKESRERISLVGYWEWISDDEYPNSSMNAKIINETQDTIEFHIISNIGAHLCEIEGYASWTDSVFRFEDEDNCVVDISFNKQSNNIDVESNNCFHYCGLNAFFDGKYKKADQFLVDRGVFNSVQSLKFREMAGFSYDEIIDNMQVMYGPDYDDASGLYVVKGNVRGLFTIMESIIIYDRDDNM